MNMTDNSKSLPGGDLAAIVRDWPGTAGFLGVSGETRCLDCALRLQREDPQGFEAGGLTPALTDWDDVTCGGCGVTLPGDGGLTHRVYADLRALEPGELVQRLTDLSDSELGARVAEGGNDPRAAGGFWVKAAHATLASKVTGDGTYPVAPADAPDAVREGGRWQGIQFRVLNGVSRCGMVADGEALPSVDCGGIEGARAAYRDELRQWRDQVAGVHEEHGD